MAKSHRVPTNTELARSIERWQDELLAAVRANDLEGAHAAWSSIRYLRAVLNYRVSQN